MPPPYTETQLAGTAPFPYEENPGAEAGPSDQPESWPGAVEAPETVGRPPAGHLPEPPPPDPQPAGDVAPALQALPPPSPTGGAVAPSEPAPAGKAPAPFY